jgi:hypothetical protein
MTLIRSAKLALVTTLFILGPTALASAHSLDACLTDIITFCETAHGDSAQRQACIQAGTPGCANHPHNGSVPPTPDPVFSANPKPGVQMGGDAKKLRQ